MRVYSSSKARNTIDLLVEESGWIINGQWQLTWIADNREVASSRGVYKKGYTDRVNYYYFVATVPHVFIDDPELGYPWQNEYDYNKIMALMKHQIEEWEATPPCPPKVYELLYR